jgi:hypothetical protein
MSSGDSRSTETNISARVRSVKYPIAERSDAPHRDCVRFTPDPVNKLTVTRATSIPRFMQPPVDQ